MSLREKCDSLDFKTDMEQNYDKMSKEVAQLSETVNLVSGVRAQNGESSPVAMTLEDSQLRLDWTVRVTADA